MSDAAIREVIDRETQAWDAQDVPLLLSVFHPDMVWAWPRSYTSVDPLDWHLPLGRFDAVRWGAVYEDLFRSRTLIHNRRSTVRIEVSAEADGAPDRCIAVLNRACHVASPNTGAAAA